MLSRINSMLTGRGVCCLSSGVCLYVLAFALPAWSQDDVPALTQQRQSYKLARIALTTEQTQVFKDLKEQLTNYPLYPYLVYEDLKRRLGSAPDAEIERFIETYADTPLAYRLRGLWLHELFDQDRWTTFLDAYDGRADPTLQCYDQRARIRAGHLEGVIEATKQLWLVGFSQVSACDRLFEWFASQDAFTDEIIWARIDLAMQYGNPALAGYLAKKLDAADRAWVALWQRAYSDPRGALAEPALRIDSDFTRKIVADAVLRLADQDVGRGKAVWENLRADYAFDTAEQDRVARDIALLSAYRHDPRAPAWLAALPTSAVNDDVRTWQARAAMRASDWPALRTAVESMQDTSDEPLMWQYWHAKALEHTGQPTKARQLYRRLAKERDYYGFLAADRLKVEYTIESEPLLANKAAVGTLMEIPGIRRAYELLRVDAETEARSEWNLLLKGFDVEQMKQAAVLASKWGWHADAIRTVALIEEFDDLELRFPMPYGDDVAHFAQARELDPAWIYGVIRRESAFAARAISSAGAQGLMQLMPTTASLTAQKAGLPVPTAGAVFDPERNIELGSAYLRELFVHFGGNMALASAAYSAGPYRVQEWLPEHRALPADAWVETIPYYETRGYVQAVLAYTAVYEWKQGRAPVRLAERMEPIPSASQTFARR
ncbi:MAG: transglycosylase SLT domain-containing protein [Gammaproteobacteria bacterium]